MHLTADMEQKVMQWLTFGCHQLGARSAGRVQLHTEAKQLEGMKEQQDKAIDMLQKIRVQWDLDTSVSTQNLLLEGYFIPRYYFKMQDVKQNVHTNISITFALNACLKTLFR